MAKSKKYYVVWVGKKTGVFDQWEDCKKNTLGVEKAQYKSFETKALAQEAFRNNPSDYIGKRPSVSGLSNSKLFEMQVIMESIVVDGACSGNPGLAEYQGVLLKTREKLFFAGPFPNGSNNIAEFLALVHALAYCQKKEWNVPIYSDSKIALSWVKQKKCKTNVVFNQSNVEIKNWIDNAEKWLRNNSYSNPLLKWETQYWGENPADFGRK